MRRPVGLRSRLRSRTAPTAVAAVFVATVLVVVAARPAAAYFERLDASSRALAFGNAYVALATDASGVAWNPGGLALLERREVQFSISRPYFVPDLLANSILAGAPALGGTVGLGWHRIGNDFISENVWLLSFGRWVYRDDHGSGYLGASLKVGRIDVDPGPEEPTYAAATAVSADLGAYYQWQGGIGIGAVLRNPTEPEIDLVGGSGGTPWRRAFDLGVAYRWRPESTVAVDWTSAGGGRGRLRAGGEIWFYDVFAVRVGVLDTEFSSGFGLKTQRWEIDTGFVTHPELGLSGRATLTVPLGGRP